MFATILILGLIVSYSAYHLYKTLKNKFSGKCDVGCSGCSLNGACPVQSLSKEEVTVSLSGK